jgi:carboxyl-terminal processing protease
MRKKVLKIIAIAVAAIFIFSTGFCLGISSSLIKRYITCGSFVNSSESSSGLLGKIYTDDSSEFDTRIIEETLKFTYGNALTEKSKYELVEAAIEGILASLDDKHTEYFTKEAYEQIMESYSGTMSGIGVVVMMDEDGQTVVVMPIQDTPAFRAGLKEGDVIVKVNGTEIKDIPLESVVSMIKGKEGTEVILTMFRPKENEEFEVKIIRERFYIPNLFSKILEEDIAYIQYIGFQGKGAQKLDEEIQKLIDSGAEGIIFDLRNNLGGVLDDAVNVSDLFLDEGLIVSVKGRSGSEEILSNYYAKKGKYTKIPLVVLINGYSASASEVVAGALKDSERAILIGEKSFGKGTVQVLKELTDGSGIKFTTAKYYLPSGSSVEGKGLHPDIMVEWDPDSEKDMQLEKAIEEINLLIDKNTSE